MDTLARKSLWDIGLDYGHGTGHGVGHFLNVHEGPMGVGIRLMPDDQGLQENMIMSNGKFVVYISLNKVIRQYYSRLKISKNFL